MESFNSVMNSKSATDLAERHLISLDVPPKRVRILCVSRYLQSATLEFAGCFVHGEGDEARIKEIPDEAFAPVLHYRLLMLFAVHGKRTERIQRTNFGYRG
jgi:hypothetical protein